MRERNLWVRDRAPSEREATFMKRGKPFTYIVGGSGVVAPLLLSLAVLDAAWRTTNERPNPCREGPFSSARIVGIAAERYVTIVFLLGLLPTVIQLVFRLRPETASKT